MKLLNSIKNNSVNHIVESGDSNGWKYVKFNDGSCYLFRSNKFTDVDINTLSKDTNFYYILVESDKFPFSIVTGSGLLFLTTRNAGIFAFSNNMSGHSTEASICLLSPTLRTLSLYVNILCIARWK